MAFSGYGLGLDREERAAINAIKSGELGSLKAYLEKHPGLNCEFSNGKTGLYYAIEFDNSEVCEFLLKRGADPDFIVDGQSTLIWAVHYNRPGMARLLIEYGADVDRPDRMGYTALIYAAELNNLEICKILIDRGANPSHANMEGKRASDFAKYYVGSSAYEYLLLMEEQYKEQEQVPSMHDGPYILWETDDRIVMAYFERNQEKNLTRMVEKTIGAVKSDTTVQGLGQDINFYSIRHSFPPDPHEVETNSDIFAVGDIHGRYEPLVNLLKTNRIIDPDLKWTFGEGQLVFLGDVFDRGDSVTEVLWFLYDLESQARSAGGNVHVLLGNHEVMALTGDHRYLDDKYRHFMRFTQQEYSRLFERNSVIGRWLRSKNLIVRINDNLFVHAGISPQFSLYGYSYAEVNNRVRDFLLSDYTIVKGSPEEIILGPLGPQWYRGYNETDGRFPEMNQQFIDAYLDSKGLARMVVGHNEKPVIKSLFDGRVMTIDVEIDESGRSAQGLLISGNRLFRCLADGTREEIE